MLKNALGTGVVDELVPPDQPFLHEYLAPGAEAVGQFGSGRLWEGRHGEAIVPEPGHLVNRLPRTSRQAEKFLVVACASKKTWYSSRDGKLMCFTLLQKGSDLL